MVFARGQSIRSHESPLLTAVNFNQVAAIEMLLELGADVNFVYEDCCPLILAIQNGSVEAVKLLLKFNADINITTDFSGMTPIHWASFYGNIEIIELLINAGADVNQKDLKGETPLVSSSQVFRSGAETVECLLKHGADPNIHGDISPLQDYVLCKDIASVKLLIEAGANLKHRNGRGYTALMYAERDQLQEMIEILKR